MYLKNKQSKIYLFTNLLAMCGIIMYIIYYFTNAYTLIELKLSDIVLIIFGLYKILMGIKRVILRKNKRGYFDCLIGIVCLAVFIKYVL
ncbi:hypothetical protein [Tepidibacter hydrothermalis]|uniref:Uncharacterized protein n=1 Tax=Tepidibacter hydrothermalis TaxID=3036126 RepID=A0ABY8E731_9FIRM|nr:hypothetical protein [Tepidibacter hydrothermalis]WFD08692.1 hypothetical protein P4S50_09785 [Tepidibacter hydrothermalis]